MSPQFNRRSFLKKASIGTVGIGLGSHLGFSSGRSANERLNIGVIGVANRASANLTGVRNENIVALCDIDETFLLRAAARHTQARLYRDFRKLLEQPGL